MGLRFLVLMVPWLVAAPLAGQLTSEEKIRFVAGTTFLATPGGQQAYILWQAQDVSRLRDRPFAVYAKTGGVASPASFQPLEVVRLQTKPEILKVMLERAPAVIHDGLGLESAIDGMFGKLLPDSSLPFEQRLSAVLQIAAFDLPTFDRLVFLSRSHPMLAVMMGIAVISPMQAGSTVTTFELRAQADGLLGPDAPFDQVIGRITLDSANPVVLPATPKPVYIPDMGAKGHLNARIRWATPETLRRMSPLTHGFNVYRVPRSEAETRGWHLTPPDHEVMAISAVTDPLVVQLNEVPILPASRFTPEQAADLNVKPDEFHFLDNNNSLGPGATGVRFVDGEQFYYFVAARDLLGRPGAISQGTLITHFDTMPPDVPTGIRVKNLYRYQAATQSSTQELEVSWEQPRMGANVSGYKVYRWENVQEMVDADSNGTQDQALIGVATHVPGTERYSLVDDSPTAPHVPEDLGKTYWYSVRAVEGRAGGTFESANSVPAFGVLRDRTGPAKGGTRVTYSDYRPTVAMAGSSVTALPADTSNFTGPGGDVGHFRLVANKLSPAIREVQYYVMFHTTGLQEPELRHAGGGVFQTGGNVMVSNIRILMEEIDDKSIGLLVVGTDLLGRHAYGIIPYDILSTLNLQSTQLATYNFNLNAVIESRTLTGGVASSDNLTHRTVVPNGTGAINPIGIDFTRTATAREFKLYKRIDDGPLLLVEQGTDKTFTSVDVSLLDYDMPAHASKLCYFLQYFDEHGNPSPLMRLGCVKSTNRTPLPQPLLADIQPLGTEQAPQASVNWFCPPEGVERFRVFISQEFTRQQNGPTSLDLLPVEWEVPVAGVPGGLLNVSAPAYLINGELYRAYQTGRVGGNFGDPSRPGNFKIILDVPRGTDFSVIVEAIAPGGHRGPRSERKDFTWAPEAPPSPQVPWPARSLPTVETDFIPGLAAQWVANGEFAGIRIGDVSLAPIVKTTTNKDFFQPGEIGFAPTTQQFYRQPTVLFNYAAQYFGINLYPSVTGETVLPCVVYRYQTPNALFPNVSGDVVQVSPLIDRLRHRVESVGQPNERVAIYDPFIDAVQTDPVNEPTQIGLFIRDTQGVVRGAAYTYLLVRFKPNGEIERVLKTNSVEIP